MAAPAQCPTVDPFTIRYVRKHASRLAGRYGFAPGDQQEIEQRLLVKLAPHLPRADPDSATWRALVAKTVRRQIANLVRDARAEKRDHRRTSSLNVLVAGEDGPVELVETVGPREADARLGLARRTDPELVELSIDIESVIERLPPNLRDLCIRLQHDSVAQVARDLGTPRSTLYRMIGQLRFHFEEAGMRGHL